MIPASDGRAAEKKKNRPFKSGWVRALEKNTGTEPAENDCEEKLSNTWKSEKESSGYPFCGGLGFV